VKGFFMTPAFFLPSLPEPNDAARTALYEGRVFMLSAFPETLQLAACVRERLVENLGSDFRHTQFQVSPDEYFARIGVLRKQIYTAPHFHKLVEAIIRATGFELSETAYDPARLRVVAHAGHENPAAAPVYYGHRDTWYSNSQSMITWWIPLHDVTAAESFEFYPDDYLRPVMNDSERFDFDEWVSEGQEKRIGWQRRETGLTATYPELRETPQGHRCPVEARTGELLLFSGQHLHQTQKNMTGQTRFSLDFRTVHVNDHKSGVGAPNVDNRSTGSSLVQYIRPN
jgi:ectoine hydroxylase-related dioxygenase (phytanoyl-CoA dioxygenase family)